MVPLTDCLILQVLSQMLQPQLSFRQLGILLGHAHPESLNLLVCCLQRLLNLLVGLLNMAGRQICSRQWAVSMVKQAQLVLVVGFCGWEATLHYTKGYKSGVARRASWCCLIVCNWRWRLVLNP